MLRQTVNGDEISKSLNQLMNSPKVEASSVLLSVNVNALSLNTKSSKWKWNFGGKQCERTAWWWWKERRFFVDFFFAFKSWFWGWNELSSSTRSLESHELENSPAFYTLIHFHILSFTSIYSHFSLSLLESVRYQLTCDYNPVSYTHLTLPTKA